MGEQSNLYKLIFILNLVADMKLTFNKLYDEVQGLFNSLTQEERSRLRELVKPDYVIDDIGDGLSEFWEESAEAYEPVDLETI